MKLLAMITLAAALPMAAHAGEQCVRGDSMGQISMTTDSDARGVATDGKKYDIAFVGPCGARHVGVYFITNKDRLPACLKAGAALPTNSEGVCVIKSIAVAGSKS